MRGQSKAPLMFYRLYIVVNHYIFIIIVSFKKYIFRFIKSYTYTVPTHTVHDHNDCSCKSGTAVITERGIEHDFHIKGMNTYYFLRIQLVQL